MRTVIRFLLVFTLLGLMPTYQVANSSDSTQTTAKEAVKGEIKQSGFYRLPNGIVGELLESPPSPLDSSDSTGQVGNEVICGFEFNFSGLGDVKQIKVKHTVLYPKPLNIASLSSNYDMPVVNGNVSGWAGIQLWNKTIPMLNFTRQFPAGDYTVMVEVMGQTLSKRFTFK